MRDGKGEREGELSPRTLPSPEKEMGVFLG
jgi:hypothetical protein